MRGPLLPVLMVWALSTQTAQAQIVPANDGTGTQVSPNGNELTITGGQSSRDGANLFHSFQQFGLDANQIANFLSNPGIRNILGRVVGGEASTINGLIQVTGGNSNLYLLNPAGIVFGPNARLNVPASFTATTASSIGFGDYPFGEQRSYRWLNAIGSNDYAALIGMPDAFEFAGSAPGAILNAGNLAVESGQSLTLLGGTIVSTGTLSAPDGQITVAAVPGAQRVRVSQTGHVLSFEFSPLSPSPLSPSPNSPPSLSQLLTGGHAEHATGATLNGNGEVVLTGSGLRVDAGDVVVQAATGGSATLSAAHTLTLVESQLQTTGNLNLLAQNTVRIRDSVTQPVTIHAGGNLSIQGNQGIDILALNHPQAPFVSGGDLTLISNGAISGDAHFSSGGNVSMLRLDGTPGQFVSLYDPIISAIGNVTFGDYTGVALKVEATGNITAGNIEITGPDSTLTGSDPDIAILTSGRALILRAGVTDLANPANVPPAQTVAGTEFTPAAGPTTGTITTGNLNTSTGAEAADGNGGPIILSATGNITVTGEINTVSDGGTIGNGGSVSLTSENGSITTGLIFAFKGRGTNPGDGGAIALNAAQNIVINGEVDSGSGGVGNASQITLTTTGGAIQVGGYISAQSNNGNGAPITLSSVGDITTNGFVSSSFSFTEDNNSGSGNAGQISLTSTGGAIQPGGNISAQSANGDGAAITLNAGSSITATNISTSGTNGNSGDVTLNAGSSITATNISTSGTNGNSAPITLNAGSSITATNISTSGTNGNGAAITLSSAGDITAGELSSAALTTGFSSGAITLTSSQGTIATDSLDARFANGSGGDITISARGNITTGNVWANQLLNGSGVSGDIAITSEAGSIDTSAGSLDTGTTFGSGGDITLSAQGSITTANILTHATNNGVGDSGNVSLTSRTGSLTTGPIRTASDNGDAGSVTLNSPSEIQVSSINTNAASQGGDVDITAGTFFRARGSFTDRTGLSASISTAGGEGGGSVTIRHGGGSRATPFTIGGAATNGTAGAITTGSQNSITSGSFPGVYRQGNPPSDIQIITTELESPPQNSPVSSLPISQLLPDEYWNRGFISPEPRFTREYERLLDIQGTRIKTLAEIQRELSEIERAVGVRPAIIYAFFVPEFLPRAANPGQLPPESSLVKIAQQDSDQLALILVTSSGEAIGRRVPQATRAKMLNTARTFARAVKNPKLEPESSYLPAAQQLYRWLVTPLQKELEQEQIQNLVYVLDSGLRSLPLAALHNGRTFLIEQYSVGLMPSMSLTDARYGNIGNVQVLAMGAAQFQPKQLELPPERSPDPQPSPSQPSATQEELPFVALELAAITPQLWKGESFLNDDFTLTQLNAQREQRRFGIVHLATHAEFNPNDPERSYIQLWNENLDFADLRKLNLSKPAVELITLSACRTAIGDELNEFGFAGLSVQMGVKSSLASLWYVNDAATFVLMSAFYRHLTQSPIKADGLRQSQLEMLKGERSQLKSLLDQLRQAGLTLPVTEPDLTTQSFAHPYYWAGFTLVGNPW